MKILIFGAGSIGVYLGTLLAASGHDVTLLGRAKLQKLHNTILIGETPYPLPKRIYSTPKKQRYDVVFITSKLYDLEENLQQLRTDGVKGRILASIQNGIVEKATYKSFVPASAFVAISVFEGFRLVENQLSLAKTAEGWKTDASPTGHAIAALLRGAGITCTITSALESLKTEKTIMNCSVNLLSAIEQKTFYELCRESGARARIEALFDESFAVLKHHVHLSPKADLKKRFFSIIAPMRHYSSTYQDASSGHRTEIEYLNGLIVKFGKKYGVKTPLNERICNDFNEKYPAARTALTARNI